MPKKIKLPDGWFMKLVKETHEERKKMHPELRKFYDGLAAAMEREMKHGTPRKKEAVHSIWHKQSQVL